VFASYPSRTKADLNASRRFAGIPVDDKACPRTCWDDVIFVLFNLDWDGHKSVLMSALWCRDLITVPAVKDLDEQSECFQDVPLTVRQEFLQKLKWAELDSKFSVTSYKQLLNKSCSTCVIII
jgi:hypothetical protein